MNGPQRMRLSHPLFGTLATPTLFSVLDALTRTEKQAIVSTLLSIRQTISEKEGHMNQEAHKAIVRRYVEMWETGNVALADDMLAASFVDHTHPQHTPGPEQVKQAILAFRTGFPDAQMHIEHLISEGDTVAVRFTVRATHQGSFAGFAPTGHAISLTGMDMLRVTDGKIVELWSCQDTLSWVLQRGATITFPA